jgi:hypothetical protein
MTSLTHETLFHQHPNQISTEADGEVLMMNIDSGTYHGLNEVASFIWNEIKEPKTLAALTAAIQVEFDVDEARCREDTLSFLKGMIEDGLVEALTTPTSC